MRKNYLHLDFKGVTPFAASFPEYLEHFAKLGYDGLILELDCNKGKIALCTVLFGILI